MTEQDIRGAGLAILGALQEIEKIEKDPTRSDKEAMVQKKLIVEQGFALGVQLLVDINRIAEALEFVAKQHNNSEALFRG